MNKMVGFKEHLRHIMLFYFHKGKNASQTQKKICAVYGEGAVDDSTCRKWFRKFRENNFNLNDAPRSGRPAEADSEKILALIESDQHTTTREIGEILGINQSTVSRRLRQLGMVNNKATEEKTSKRRTLVCMKKKRLKTVTIDH